MKKVDIAQSTVILRGKVTCPHCCVDQEDLDEYDPTSTYECENCWRFYTVIPKAFEVANEREANLNHILDALEGLKKRLKKVEKELGIK